MKRSVSVMVCLAAVACSGDDGDDKPGPRDAGFFDAGDRDGGVRDAGERDGGPGADQTPPTVTITAPANGATLMGTIVLSAMAMDDVAVARVEFAIDGTVVETDATAPYQTMIDSTTLADGAHSFEARGIDTSDNVATDSVSVRIANQDLPPDPSTVATPNPNGLLGPAALRARFLFEGQPPIQTGVDPGDIDNRRIAVVRGRVLDCDGNAMGGVIVRVLDGAAFGQTLSRADGRYDLAVNGGGPLTITYEQTGFLGAQRTVDVPWHQMVVVDDLMLVPLDPQQSVIDLTLGQLQTARGTPVTDDDGTRQATVLFPAGISAELVLPDGTRQATTTITVRATEYTNGVNGPMKMPAKLPENSGYTFAVEFSIDEAIAAGAQRVEFSAPVFSYVENFLGFSVGTTVPSGAYDRTQGCWVPSDDGLVIAIVGVDGNGRAEIDIDGDGSADDLTALGFTDDERTTVATLYGSGAELWRVPLTHFTPYDLNWPFGPPPGASGPRQGAPTTASDRDDPCPCGGSIIEVENQVLGERIPIVGTPLQLNYWSDRVPGWLPSIDVPVTGPTVPPGLERITLALYVAGRVFEASLPPDANQTFTFDWDRMDAYGRRVQGNQDTAVRLAYVYPGTYQGPGTLGRAFAAYGGQNLGVTARGDFEFVQNSRVKIADVWDARMMGLGGFTIGVHHAYDVDGQTIHLGSGGEIQGENINASLVTIAGNTDTPAVNDNGPARLSTIQEPGGVAIGADGLVYLTDRGNDDNSVRVIALDGTISTLVGGVYCEPGVDCLEIEEGPLSDVRLANPGGIAFDPKGRLYIADSDNQRIRRIDSDGVMRTVAGSGPGGFKGAFTGDGGPARSSALNRPADVAVDDDCTVYIADSANNRIRRVGTDGVITTVAGGGTALGDDGPAIAAQLARPTGVTVGPDGALFIADTDNHRIRRVGADGIITTVAGDGTLGFAGDGGPATGAALQFPHKVAFGPDGAMYIADQGNHRIRRVGTDGVIVTAAGTGESGSQGEDGPATLAELDTPVYVASGPDGVMYVVDHSSAFFGFAVRPGRVRKLLSPLPGYTGEEQVVPSANGRELFVFDPEGRHLATVHAYTFENLWQFSYDIAGYLFEVADADGDVTTIERDAGGTPTAIVSPYGQRTTLTVDNNGYLASATDPANGTWMFTVDTAGRLMSFSDRNQNVSTFTYDSQGRLIRDDDSVGGAAILTRTTATAPVSETITMDTTVGRSRSYRIERLPDGNERRVLTRASGAVVESVAEGAGRVTLTAADGTTMTREDEAHPTFGALGRARSQTITTTPSGLRRQQHMRFVPELSDPLDPFTLTSIRQTLETNSRFFDMRYDVATRTWTLTSPFGRVTTIETDQYGRALTTQAAGLAPSAVVYDAAGRPEMVMQGTGAATRTTSFVYGTDGYVQSITDAENRTVSFVRDAAGRVTRATLPDSEIVDFTHDAEGNILTITPPGRPSHTLAYSAESDLIQYTPPAAGVTNPASTYVFDADSKLVSVTLPGGRVQTYTRDAGGGTTGLAIARGAFAATYQASGNVATMTSPDGITNQYGYDGHLPELESWSGGVVGTVRYVHDDDFDLVERTAAGVAIQYGYDNDKLLTMAGNMTITRSNSHGLVTGTALGNVATTHTYNEFAEPTGYVARYQAATIFSQAMTRDRLGRITQIVENVQGTATTYDYVYDVRGRLTQVDVDATPTYSYTYDGNDNRVTANGAAAAYDDQDRLLSQGTMFFTNDANGTWTSRSDGGQVSAYTYDDVGTLTSVLQPNGAVVSYLVDGKNRRVARAVDGVRTAAYLYANNRYQILAELGATGTLVSRFVWGPTGTVPEYMVQTGTSYRIIADHTNSPRLVVDVTTGNVIQRIDYDPYGRVTNDTNPGFIPFGFTGGLYDPATGLVRLKSRDYDASVGRWTAKDIYRFAGRTTNLYSYVRQDPINRIDPFGRTWYKPWTWGWGDDVKDPGVGDVVDVVLSANGQIPVNTVSDAVDITLENAPSLAAKRDNLVEYNRRYGALLCPAARREKIEEYNDLIDRINEDESTEAVFSDEERAKIIDNVREGRPPADSSHTESVGNSILNTVLGVFD